jgi:hypothetical protein
MGKRDRKPFGFDDGYRTQWKTVVAAKKYNGVTVAYIVGWKSPWDGRVRNIRAGKYFAKVEDAQAFRKEIEAGRQHKGVEFDIIK